MLPARKHVSKLIKVLCKLTLQSIYGTKIAQNGTRNSTKRQNKVTKIAQNNHPPRLTMDAAP